MKTFEIYSVTNEGVDNMDVVTLDELKNFDTSETKALEPFIEGIENMLVDQVNNYSNTEFECIEVSRIE